MSMACRSHPLHKKTILRRVMTTWHLEDITPLRTSQEAEEMKEKQKRKAQIAFLAPNAGIPSFWISHPFLELSSTWLYCHGLGPMKINSVPTEIFILQSRCSFRKSLWSPHHFWHVILLLLQTTITPYSRVSLSPSSKTLPGTSRPFLLPQSPLFSVSTSSSSVSCLTYPLVISGLSSGLRGLIWLSLCPLSPLPMVLVSRTPAKSSFPSRSWHFLDCNEFSIHILLIYLWMICMNVSVLISPPWSTDRKKNPLLSFPRKELVKGACFPLSAVLRTLALCFSAPKA